MSLAEEITEKYFGKRPGPWEQRYLMDSAAHWTTIAGAINEAIERCAQKIDNDLTCCGRSNAADIRELKSGEGK